MSNNSIVFEQSIDKNDKLLSKINEFVSMFKPLEINSLNILQDNLTQAIFCECHVRAKELVSLGTTDVPLDTERQSDYKANRDVVEDSIAYNQMKEDAKNKRTFSNIVAEYNDSFDGSFPLKIIGGQHRFNAISEAFKNSKINELHGVKVYFNLNMDQRLDVQLISTQT